MALKKELASTKMELEVHAFFGIMVVEFRTARNKIKQLQANNIATEVLDDYKIMRKIMTAPALGIDDIHAMQNIFPEYAQKFNELRKLMYLQTVKPLRTLH